MPSSTGVGSPESPSVGVMLSPHSEHEHMTVTFVPADGVCRLAESSTARTLIVEVGLPWTVQLYVQLVVPVAGCQVVPLSVETSTPATWPPTSVAVPLSVTLLPSAALEGQARSTAVGAVVSVDCEAEFSVDI